MVIWHLFWWFSIGGVVLDLIIESGFECLEDGVELAVFIFA